MLEPQPEIEISDGTNFFFRVVHPNPNRLKTVRLPWAAGGRIRGSMIAVTLHSTVETTSDKPHVRSEATDCGNSSVMLMSNLDGLGKDVLFEKLDCVESGWRDGVRRPASRPRC